MFWSASTYFLVNRSFLLLNIFFGIPPPPPRQNSLLTLETSQIFIASCNRKLPGSTSHSPTLGPWRPRPLKQIVALDRVLTLQKSGVEPHGEASHVSALQKAVVFSNHSLQSASQKSSLLVSARKSWSYERSLQRHRAVYLWQAYIKPIIYINIPQYKNFSMQGENRLGLPKIKGLI